MADAELGIAPLILDGAARCGYAVVTWGYDLEWAGRDAFLTELYLRPARRGRGLGGAALGAIERAAVSHGARALHLMVREENHAAVRLYRGAGYVSPPRTFLTKVLSDDR
jgi:ribosomal protein S18 acetylase RimI-like enzyme